MYSFSLPKQNNGYGCVVMLLCCIVYLPILHVDFEIPPDATTIFRDGKVFVGARTVEIHRKRSGDQKSKDD